MKCPKAYAPLVRYLSCCEEKSLKQHVFNGVVVRVVVSSGIDQSADDVT